MSLVRIGGGGKTEDSTRYRWKKYATKKYFYKNGVEVVPWDKTTKMILQSGFTWIGWFSFTESALYSSLSASGSVNTNIVVKDPVDLTGATSLNVKYNSTSVSVPLNGFEGFAYPSLEHYYNGNCYLRVDLLSAKVGYVGDLILNGTYVELARGSAPSVTVSEYWAEGKFYIEDVTGAYPNSYPDGYDETGEFYYESVDTREFFINKGEFAGPLTNTEYTKNDGSLEKYDDYISMLGTASGQDQVLLTNPIDLTEYDSVIVEASGTAALGFGFTSNSVGAPMTFAAGATTNTAKNIFVLDTSKLIGNYRFGANLYNAGSRVNIYKMYGLKPYDYYPAVDPNTPYQYVWKKYKVKNYLYNNGDECTDYSGGWQTYGVGYATSAPGGSVTKASDRMIGESSGDNQRQGAFSGRVDLTNIQKLYFDVNLAEAQIDAYDSLEVGITSMTNVPHVDSEVSIVKSVSTTTKGRMIMEFDASDYNGLYSVIWNQYYVKKSYVFAIWAETHEFIETLTSLDPKAYEEGLTPDGEYYIERVDNREYLVRNGFSNFALTATKNSGLSANQDKSGYLTLTPKGSGWCIARSSNLITTKYKEVHIECYDNYSSVENQQYGLCDNSNSLSGSDWYSTASGGKTLREIVLPITKDSYIYFQASGYNIYIKNMWLVPTDKTFLYLKGNVENPLDKAEGFIPSMTSNNGADGTKVSASGVYGASYPAYLAFDKNTSSAWVGPNTSVSGQWLQVEFSSPKVVSAVKIRNKVDATNVGAPRDVVLMGSNDGTDFVELGSYQNLIGDSGAEWAFYVDNHTAYKFYRVNFNSVVTGQSYISVSMLQMYNVDFRVAKAKDRYAVDWDNKGYSYSSGWVSDGGFNLDGNKMSVDMPSTAKHNRYIVTNELIDLSEYSKIKAEYSFGNKSGVFEGDISKVSNGYIGLAVIYSADNVDYFDLIVSSSKNNFDTSNLGGDYTYISPHASRTANITKVWLEK